MTHRQIKTSYFALTSISTIASSYYFNYLFFYLRDHYGFGNRENLLVAALHGGIYIFSAYFCGRFAERRGYLTSLSLGFAGLALCMGSAAIASSASAQMWTLAAYSVVLLLIWPAVEALVTHDEPPSHVPHIVGVYNLTWSSSQALSYFTGGTLFDAFGTGAIFVLPGVLFLGQLGYVSWLRGHLRPDAGSAANGSEAVAVRHPDLRAATQAVPPATFLTLAWIANPFAYMAMYTMLAVMPDLAQRLGLSPTRVGLFCSVWMFSRVVAFGLLWRWTGWHYRFRWMVGAFAAVIACFAAILTAHALWVIVVAQVFFGFAAGLIYYASLFYSMDVGEAKGEHGGLHEAAIGIGICAGPALGALSLQVWPHVANANALAVSALLGAGFISLLAVWARARMAVRSAAGLSGRV